MHGFANDGSSPTGSGRSPHDQSLGQAALLLVESLMHGLVAKGTVSREEFIEIVEGAAEVEHELVTANASYPSFPNRSLLHPLANAFKRELGR